MLIFLRGNRFQDVLEDEKLASSESVFRGIKELAVDETLLAWEEICHIAAKFPSLSSLFSSANQLSSLSPITPAPFTTTLVSVHMEFNEFTCIADIAPLAAVTSLRNLHLKGNRISAITPTDGHSSIPVFTANLQYLDVSYNQVSAWSFIDSLPTSFPGLSSLRFAHNPIYNNPDLDNQEIPTSSNTKATSSTEEAYMLLLARLPPTLKIINFSAVTASDRSNAEMFYLSRIARQLSAVPEADEARVLARHRRWAELCELYGKPAVVRRREMNPNFLEARLISVDFQLATKSPLGDLQLATRTAKIPKAYDIYAVKGIVGKLFGLPPLRLRLVWETGEWDPVAGFDEEDSDDSSGEDEALGEIREADKVLETPGKGAGRWVKRETELRDGPRQFGYCVDGLAVKVRVETS